MSPLPGYEVDLVDVPPSIGSLVNSGVLFAVGHAANAVTEEIYGVDQFVDAAGDRDPASSMYDGLDAYFHEGGYKAYVATVAMDGDDADIVAALDYFDAGLGIGQIAAFGLTTETVQKAVMQKAYDTGRVAILDGTDTATAATLVSQAEALTGSPGDRFSALFAPWDVAPGISTGTTRTIPPSGRICGNIARNDSLGLSPNDPAAGLNGVARWTQDLSQVAWGDSDRTLLNTKGVNVTRMMRNKPRTMGWRSLADQETDDNWSMFSGSRLVMVIKFELGIVAENFEFNKIDAREHTLKKFQGALTGVLLPFFTNDDLYGATPQEAFNVDVGPSVNSLESLAEGYLKAKIALKTSPFGERVVIQVAKIPLTESIAA
jgi:Bacteriophage tail sheath protein